MSDGIPTQFQNIWLHIMALGKDSQKLVKDISSNFHESNSSAKAEKVFRTFATSPEERDVKSLEQSIYCLVQYLVLSQAHSLWHSSRAVPHEMSEAVGLGIQLVKDVFGSLVPAVQNSILQKTLHVQVWGKVACLIRSQESRHSPCRRPA